MLSHKSYVVVLMLLLLAVAACQPGSGSGGGSSSVNPTATAQNATLEASRADIAAMNLSDSQLLLWVGPGEQAGRHSPSNPGQIVLLNQSGAIQSLMDVPTGSSRIYACTESATSPDGRYFSFFVGGLENGTLYLMDGVNSPQEVAAANALSCNGAGTFQFAPDSSRFGYMDYRAIPAETIFPNALLHIVDVQSRARQNTFENVSGFRFGTDFVSYVRLFTDSQNRPREAAVFVWREGNPVEITTLFAESGCEFRDGQIAVMDEDRLAVLMGEICAGRSSKWALYVVEISTRIATLSISDEVPGAFSAITQIMTLFPSPDGSRVFFTYPNGLAFNRGNLQLIDTASPRIREPLLLFTMMPRHQTNANNIYNPSANALPAFSNDGRWLALVTNNRNNNAALNLIDLNAPDLPPLSISAGGQGAVVSAMHFTPDSQRLVFVAGGHSRDSNSLFSVDLSAGTLTDTRIVRGRYTPQMVVSPDSRFVALGEWLPNYQGLTLVNLESQQSGLIFAGAGFDESGRLVNQQFVYPLSWRR